MSGHIGTHRRTSWRETRAGSAVFRVIATMLAVLLGSSVAAAFAGPAQATGNNGTIKVHALGSEPGTESNEPKVCAFNLEFFGFDEGTDGYVEFDVQGGDGPTGVAAGPFAVGTANADGYFESQYFNVEGGPAIANGHYMVTMYGKFNGEPNYEDVKAKSKVFKVDCPPTEEPPTIPDCPAITGTVVVTPSNLQGFDFSQTRATGHYEFLENGLRIYTESNTSTDKVAAYKAVNVPLSGVGDPLLEYVNTAGVEPGFQLVIDFDGNGTPDGILVGEKVYGDDWWLTGSSAQFVKDGAPNTGGGSGSEWFGTLDEWYGEFPDAVVKQFGFSLGSGVKGDGVIKKITFACTEYVFTTDKPKPGTAVASSDVCVKPGEANGVATVTVTNTADGTKADVTYEVKLNGETKTVTVADGQSGSVQFTGLAPGDYAWSVTGPDGTKVNDTVTVKKCDVPPPPPPNPPYECPPGTVWVGDTNGNGVKDPAECQVPQPPTPPTPTPEPEPKQVKGKVWKLDKCGPNNFFKAKKVKGGHYVYKGKTIREGVWLKAKGMVAKIKFKADSSKYEVGGKKLFVVKFPNDAPCSPNVEEPPHTGLRLMAG